LSVAGVDGRHRDPRVESQSSLTTGHSGCRSLRPTEVLWVGAVRRLLSRRGPRITPEVCSIPVLRGGSVVEREQTSGRWIFRVFGATLLTMQARARTSLAPTNFNFGADSASLQRGHDRAPDKPRTRKLEVLGRPAPACARPLETVRRQTIRNGLTCVSSR
jgi:hypothetical protein